MNYKQQTSVDWLYNNLKSHFEHDGDLLEVVQMSFEKAKEIEKQQITQGFKKGLEYWNGDEWKLIDIEQYYKETYGE